MKNNYIFGIFGIILLILSCFTVWDFYLVNVVCMFIFGITFLMIMNKRKHKLFYNIMKYILIVICILMLICVLYYFVKYYFYLDTILPLLNIFLQVLIVINIVMFFIKKSESNLLINIISYVILYSIILISFMLNKDMLYIYFTSSIFYMIITLVIMLINSLLEHKKTA